MRLDVTVRRGGGEERRRRPNIGSINWWDDTMEESGVVAEHRTKLKVLRFRLAGVGATAEHLRAVVRGAPEYYPGLEILEIDVRNNSIDDTGLPPNTKKLHRLRRLCVRFSGRHVPSVAVVDAWLASMHATCEPSVPPSDRSYRVVIVTDDGH